MLELLKSVLLGFVVFWILILIAGTVSGFEVLLILLLAFGSGYFRHRWSRRNREHESGGSGGSGAMPEFLKSLLTGLVVFWVLILISGTVGRFEVLLFLLLAIGSGYFRHRFSRKRAESRGQ